MFESHNPQSWPPAAMVAGPGAKARTSVSKGASRRARAGSLAGSGRVRLRDPWSMHEDVSHQEDDSCALARPELAVACQAEGLRRNLACVRRRVAPLRSRQPGRVGGGLVGRLAR
jgi:hypothetical protein